MSLEKILIFGIGIAVFMAITSVAITRTNDTTPDKGKYKTGVEELVKKTK